MIQTTQGIWTETEKEIAYKAFKIANERETETLIKYICQKATEITKVDDLWQLNDFLSARRHQMEGKYDYRFSVLIFVFAELLKEGWLSPDDLAGLEPEKITKIAALARM